MIPAQRLIHTLDLCSLPDAGTPDRVLRRKRGRGRRGCMSESDPADRPNMSAPPPGPPPLPPSAPPSAPPTTMPYATPGSRRAASGREQYNVIADTVVGPNLRLKDNLIQAASIIVCLLLGVVVGAL